jgi:ATP-dependent DNA helicase RecQ
MLHTEMLRDTEPERRELLEAKLRRMKQYAEAEICRRRILLSYFNETVDKDCGNCDVCRNPPVTFDGTIIAQKALSAIARTDEKINATLLTDILRGSHNRYVVEKGYDRIKTWGAGKDLKPEEWNTYIWQLVNSGYIDMAYDEGYTLKLNAQSRLVLSGQLQVSLVSWRPYERRPAAEPSRREIVQSALLDRLKLLRKRIADENGVPAYIVFNDRTLQEMAEKIPSDRVAIMEISGVGEKKFATYGQLFLDELLSFMSEEAGKGIRIKGATDVLSFEMFSQGKSIEEIAAERRIMPATVLGHLVTMHEKGFDVNLHQFIGSQELDSIRRAVTATGARGSMKPIFDHLDGEVDYGKIRIGLAILAKEDPESAD